MKILFHYDTEKQWMDAVFEGLSSYEEGKMSHVTIEYNPELGIHIDYEGSIKTAEEMEIFLIDERLKHYVKRVDE